MENVFSTLNSLNPYIRAAAVYTMPLNWVLEERVIFDYEILYVKAGKAKIMIRDTTYEAKPGSIFLFRPNVPHSIQCCGKENFVQMPVHFDFFFDDKSEEVYINFAEIHKSPPKNYFRRDIISPSFFIKDQLFTPHHIIIENLIANLIAVNTSPLVSDMLKKKALLLEIIALLIEHSNPPEENTYRSDSFRFFNNINKSIENCLATKLDLKKIAMETGYSPNHLATIYKKHFGMSMKHYHEQIKLVRAVEYLAQKDISITEIAYSLGFSAIHDFSRFFKRLTALSPLQYRNKILSPNTDI